MSIQLFKNRLAENRKNKAENAELDKLEPHSMHRLPTNRFHLACEHIDGRFLSSISTHVQRYESLVVLDDEDTKYFIDKYFPKLKEEQKAELQVRKENIKKDIDKAHEKLDNLDKELKDLK